MGSIQFFMFALTALYLVRRSAQMDISFYQYTSMDDGDTCTRSSISCKDVGPDGCCTASSPFCWAVQCTKDCPDEIFTINTYGENSCNGSMLTQFSGYSNYSACGRVHPNGAEPANCAAHVWLGDPQKRDVDDMHQCSETIEPDTFRYVDTDGVEQEINLPNGTLHGALPFIMGQEYNALRGYLDAVR